MTTYAPLSFVPRYVFFTSGTGSHETQRVAMQRAMEEAGVADQNLVKVSSVMAPGIQVITKPRGLRMVRPGAMTFAVIAQGETKEPHQRVSVALAWSTGAGNGLPGFITEVEQEEAMGKSGAAAEDECGEALVGILADQLDATVDPKKVWERRKRGRIRVGSRTLDAQALSATAIGPEIVEDKERYAVAFACAVFL